MSGRYVLQTHVTFAAAHQLHGYDGDCARLHGHNYRVEVEVTATRLDEVGLGMDFREIRRAAGEVADALDHRHLNEIPPFDRENPSAENLAKYFFDRVGELLNRPHARVSAVTVWETERCFVRYEE